MIEVEAKTATLKFSLSKLLKIYQFGKSCSIRLAMLASTLNSARNFPQSQSQPNPKFPIFEVNEFN